MIPATSSCARRKITPRIGFGALACLVGCAISPSPGDTEADALAQPAATCPCPSAAEGALADGDRLLSRVSKWHALPNDYRPRDLVSVPGAYLAAAEGKLLRVGALASFIAMSDEAFRQTGHHLKVFGAHRSVPFQCTVYQRYCDNPGRAAVPGHSEHHLGTAIDASIDDSGECCGADPEVASFVTGRAWEFGYAVSYPVGSSATTGYDEEPWHLRFIGRRAAAVLRTTAAEVGRPVSVHEFVHGSATIAPLSDDDLQALSIDHPSDVDAVRQYAESACEHDLRGYSTCGGDQVLVSCPAAGASSGVADVKTCAGRCLSSADWMDDVCENGDTEGSPVGRCYRDNLRSHCSDDDAYLDCSRVAGGHPPIATLITCSGGCNAGAYPDADRCNQVPAGAP